MTTKLPYIESFGRVTVLVLLTCFSSSVTARGQSKSPNRVQDQAHNWEVAIKNKSESSVTCKVFYAGTTNQIGSTITMDPDNESETNDDDECIINTQDTPASETDIDAPSNTLLRIEIDGEDGSSYQYMSCAYSAMDFDEEVHGFFCPYGSGAHAKDFVIEFYSGTDVRVYPYLNNGSATDDVEVYFGSATWVLPYNLSTYCNGSPGCNSNAIGYFLTPQTNYTDEYSFPSGHDIAQPSSTPWYVNGETLHFPSGVDLSVTSAYNISGGTIDGGNLSANSSSSINLSGTTSIQLDTFESEGSVAFGNTTTFYGTLITIPAGEALTIDAGA